MDVYHEDWCEDSDLEVMETFVVLITSQGEGRFYGIHIRKRLDGRAYERLGQVKLIVLSLPSFIWDDEGTEQIERFLETLPLHTVTLV